MFIPVTQFHDRVARKISCNLNNVTYMYSCCTDEKLVTKLEMVSGDYVYVTETLQEVSKLYNERRLR
jgi:hypothetical protein